MTIKDMLTFIMLAIACVVFLPFALSLAFHTLAVLCTATCQFIEACARGVTWLAVLPLRLVRYGWRKLAH